MRELLPQNAWFGALTLTGTISAVGPNGSTSLIGLDGGGGGGVVVLASAASVTVNAGAVIDAHGGAGINAFYAGSGSEIIGASGGGGGGLVRLLSPTTTSSGTLDVAGGSPGVELSGALTAGAFYGGNAGGGSVGSGGYGSSVSSSGMSGVAPGGNGLALVDTGVDPGAFFY